MLQEEKMEEKRKKDKEEIQKRFAEVERGLPVETELPHNPVNVVLDVDVIKDRLPRHPVLVISQA